MRGRVRSWFDGAGWFVGPAIALLLFALIVVFGELQSPDVVLFTGRGVTGTEQGGIVSYQWRGQTYTLDAPGYGSSQAVSVYLDPANPSIAMIDSAINRAIVGTLVGAPVAGAVVLLLLPPTRTYWRRRREMRGVPPPAGYGSGLDPEFVARRLQELRRGDGRE